MGIRPRFTARDVRKDLMRRAALIDRAIINTLAYLGELCINHARSLKTYQDQTGNLRSSIGYLIVKDGRVVRTNFAGNSQGQGRGRDVARQLADEHPSGYALIVVAGMNYATAVESRGLDVLASAEQLAETELPRMLRDLKIDVATLG